MRSHLTANRFGATVVHSGVAAARWVVLCCRCGLTRSGYLIARTLYVLSACCALACRFTGGAANHPAEGLGPQVPVTHLRAHISDQQISGQSFPPRVLALTWDDGPDVHTLDLAHYLYSQHVAATFFVVQRWNRDISSDPGLGRDTFQTGYANIPVLEELVRLGHRIGNHTLNHPLLTRLSPSAAVQQVVQNQAGLEPFITNDLRLLRVPGGAFGAEVAAALDADPRANSLIGPIRWDIDQKDWQDSLECHSAQPALECEPWDRHPAWRLKPTVAARRYLEAIEQSPHGIVLLHDRVGAVGSTYALELAHALIPELNRRGYVLVAPILAFSALAEHKATAASLRSATSPKLFEQARIAYDAQYHFADLNGDGRLDRCAEQADGIMCALAQDDGQFATPRRWSAISCRSGVQPEDAARLRGDIEYSRFQLADVTGDGLADCCAHTSIGITCAASDGRAFVGLERWSSKADFSAVDPHAWFMSPAYYQTIRYADINGDGRADICGRSSHGVACALSTGTAFTDATEWLSAGMSDADGWLARDPADLRLTDVNGDGRADWCGNLGGSVSCGLAP